MYGPVPTGERLVGASREAAPLYFSNKCFGICIPRALTKASAQNGVCFWKSTLIGWSSTLETLMSLYAPIVVAAVAGSEAYSQLKTQSSALKGSPSCH